MTFTPLRLAGISLLAATLHGASLAESIASSASSAGSKSIGSLSDSVTGSSKSSSGDTKVAEGDYRVIEVAERADQPGMLQIRLQANALAGAEGTLWLTLPQQALARHTLAAGDVVSARNRPYGVEFAHAAGPGAAPQAFFLLLAADWRRELDPQALTL